MCVVGPATLLACSALFGCHHALSNAQARSEARAAAAEQRQELEQIRPPSKSRYMAVRSYDTWENPYITVQPDMLTVHILYADANPSAYGAGGMLRPTAARRQEVNIQLSKLGEAMTSVPQGSWPYGRVVAVEEAHESPGKEEQALRRNLETTVSILNDLGIVAYDLNSGVSR
ncbi:MAG: hypothetical protein INR62_13135 [Rhodospirillales bacterium]|nr:hypothetical protein [Acetobacter sp.]